MPVSSSALRFSIPLFSTGKGHLAVLITEQAHRIQTGLAELISAGFRTVVWLSLEEPAVKPYASGDLAHCSHMHLPCISDTAFGINFDLQWPLAGLVLRQRLRRGEKILLCGPSVVSAGVAIRLLNELGEAIPTSLRQAVSFCPTGFFDSSFYDSDSLMAQQDALADKQWGCLLGGMLGAGIANVQTQRPAMCTFDIGSLLEDHNTIRLQTDHGGQMMLATLYGLRACHHSGEIVHAVKKTYLAWLAGQQGHRITCEWIAQFPAMQAPYQSHQSAKSRHARPWKGIPLMPGDPRDAGALLHVAPIILMEGLSMTAKEQLANDICAITHQDPVTRRACRIWINLLDTMLYANSLAEVLQNLRDTSTSHPMPESLQQALYRAEMFWLTGVPYGASLMNSGHTTEDVLGIALYAVLSANSVEVIQLSTRHQGDCISTATLAMQLFGSQHGLSQLPWSKITQLDLWTALLAMPDSGAARKYQIAPPDQSHCHAHSSQPLQDDGGTTLNVATQNDASQRYDPANITEGSAMPVLLSGIFVAVVLFYLFRHTGDTSLKRTLKRWVGYALMAVLAWAILGFSLVSIFPIVVCGVVIFMALRWLLNSAHQVSPPQQQSVQPTVQLSHSPGYRMQRLRKRHLLHRCKHS